MFEITLDELTNVFVGTALLAVFLGIRTGTPPRRDFAKLNKPCPYIVPLPWITFAICPSRGVKPLGSYA
jgi:hypothetical protein